MAKPTGHGGIDYPDFLQGTTPHENPIEITRAEHAIRMGYPQVFERTGNLLFIEGFENGLGDWNPNQSHAANAPQLATRGLMRSPYCVKLVIDPTPAGFSSIRKHLGYPYVTTFGLEYSFLADDSFGLLLWGIIIYTGEFKYTVWSSYSDVTHLWAVLDDVPAYQTVLDYDIGAWDHMSWHTVKVVADLVNEQYARMSVDKYDMGISQYVVRKQPDVTPPYIYLGIDTFIAGARVVNIYVDNVILTINEPL